MRPHKFLRPRLLCRRQVDLIIMAAQARLRFQQAQEGKIIFYAVAPVVLSDCSVDKQPVQHGGMVIFMAHPHRRSDQPGDEAVMNAALRMGVDGDIVVVLPQLPEESQRLRPAVLDQVFLIDRVEVRMSVQHVPRPGPQNERVNGGAREVGAQFVNQRCSEERVANSCERDDEKIHSTNGSLDFLYLCRGETCCFWCCFWLTLFQHWLTLPFRMNVDPC